MRTIFALIGLCVMLFSGCASLNRWTTDTEDVEVQQKRRRDEVTKDFEEKRDTAQLQASLSRWKSGDVKGCREGLEQLLERNPRHHEARLLLADLMLSDQQPDAAIAQLKQVLEEDPSNARAQHSMGLASEASGKAEEALTYFQHASELDQKNQLYALSYQTAQDASRIEAEGGADLRESTGGAAWDDATTNASVMQTLDRAGGALADGDFAQARAGFAQAAAAEPGNAKIPLHAAIFSLRHEHPELAVELLTPATRKFPKSAALYRVLGTAHYRLGDFPAAQLALQQALSLDKSNALAYFLMGCTLKKLGQSDAADQQYELACKLNPSFAAPHEFDFDNPRRIGHLVEERGAGMACPDARVRSPQDSPCRGARMKPWFIRFWPSLTGLALLALSVAVSENGYGTQSGLWLVRTGFLLTGFLLGSSLMGLVLQRLKSDERVVRRYFTELLRAQDRTLNHRLPDEVPAGPWSDICRRISAQLADLRIQLVELEAARASTELRARRQETRADQVGAILSALPEPVIAIDHYDELVLANASAEELFDIDASSGQHRALAKLVRCEKLVALLTETRKRKAPSCRMGEIEVSDAAGQSHAYSVTARMMGSKNAGSAEGNGTAGTVGAVAVLRDISSQRALQKRNAEFVSAVSHEMKTPLAGIKAYVELLADGDADDEATEQEFLQVINSQADRLQRLIDNLLNLSRIEAGVVNVEKQSRPLNELLDEAFRVVQPLAESKQIKLMKDLSPLYLGVFADRDMLLQAAINLLSNAVKYTPQGGHVTLRSRLVDNDVQFEVEDNGVGLGPEDCEKVFEKFYRVRKDKDMATGTGLGLPLAKHIVEDVHGGKLWVESTPGHGSTFSIRLPGAARMS